MFGSKSVSFKVLADTLSADLDVDKITAKLKKIADTKFTAKVGTNLADSVKLREYEMTLDRIGRKVARPRVSSEGLAKANLEADKLLVKMDALGGKDSGPGFFGSRFGRFGGNLLKAPFSGNAISQLVTGNAGQMGGLASFFASPGGLAAGAGLIGALAGLVPGLVGGAAGVGIGGAGLFGAYKEDPKAFAGSLKTVDATLKSVFSSVAPGFAGIARQVAGFVKSLGPSLTSMFKASIPGIRQFIVALEPAVRQLLPDLTKMLVVLTKSGLMSDLGNAFGTLLVAATKALTGLSVGFKASGTLIVQVARVIGAAVELIGRGIGGMVRVADDLIHGKWASAWIAARSTFRDFARILDTDLGGLAHNVSAWFDRIRHGTAAIWDATWAHISSAFDSWRHHWADTWDTLWQQSIGTLIRFNSASERDIANWISDVVSFFARLPGQVGRALSSLGSELLSIGRGAISDMLHGMQSVAGGLLSWVSNFVKNIWGDVKKFFGFGSPSRLFYNAGKNIVLGMAHGIKDHAHHAVTAARAMSASVGGHVSGTAAQAQAYGRRLASAYGWAGQWSDINAVAMRESGWNPAARNPSSGAFGIAQFINGASEYYAYGGNPGTIAGQDRAFFNYIRARYGNPAAAWAHELNYGWYDKGGKLPPGLSLALNTTGHDEIHTHGSGSGDTYYTFNLMQPGFSDAEALNMIKTLRKYKIRHGQQTLGIA